jgi:hypothetical protein
MDTHGRNRASRIWTLTPILFLLLCGTGFADLKRYYDEIRYHGSSGTKRPEYLGVRLPTTTGLIPSCPSSILSGTGNSLLNTPLILPRYELEVLQRGLSQRIRALASFFEDIAIGNRRSLGASGFVPDVVIEQCLRKTTFRNLDNLRTLWKGRSSSSVSFVLGTDFVRSPDGNFLVLEDNINDSGSVLGGLGSIPVFIDEFNRLNNANFAVPPSDFEEIVNAFARLNGIKSNHELVFLRGRTSEFEILSLASNLARNGIIEYVADSLANALEFWLKNGQGYRGVINFFQPADLFLFNKGVPLLNAPGIEPILTNKAILPYVDHMIRFFLHEEPIIQTVPSQNLFLAPLSKPPGYHFVPVDRKPPFDVTNPVWAGFAIKHPQGISGDGVILTDFFTADELRSKFYGLVTSTKDHADQMYVVQPYIEPSRIEDWSIVLRGIGASFGGGRTFAGRMPIGRALPPDRKGEERLKSRGTINVSKGAAVVVCPVPSDLGVYVHP